MEFSTEFFYNIAKRAWKLSWILILNIIISLFVILFIFIDKNLFFLSNIEYLDSNILSIIFFFVKSALVSIILFVIFYILKGDSDLTIKKLREKFYVKIIDRVKLVFEYRFNFPEKEFNHEIKELTEYCKTYVDLNNNNREHTIDFKNIKYHIINGIDSLYFTYELEKNKKILFSIWHSGKFIAIAIAIKKNCILDYVPEQINNKYESSLNLADTNNVEKERLSIRDGYWWFDIKYDTSEDFLFNNFEQEQIARKIAHIITIGLISSFELMGWKKFIK